MPPRVLIYQFHLPSNILVRRLSFLVTATTTFLTEIEGFLYTTVDMFRRPREVAPGPAA